MASSTVALHDRGPSAAAVQPEPKPRQRRLPLVQQYLREQQELTAVERFAQLHEEEQLPAQARYYESLLPTAKPKAGQQYGFSVDLDRCTGCKACVTACHNLNGLDENETWRTVGLLHGGTVDEPMQQTVTTACHHCIEPACMAGCPVNAYEKDPATGIVKHLDDQCIGCKYCTLTCPYEVPQFNKKLGIVRKCDLCSDRLAEDEAPACVQACPNEAISIRIVDTQQVVDDVQGDSFLPRAPSPGITLPTTEYKTKRVFPKNTLPADFYNVRPSEGHLPLVVLLVLNQLAVGAFAVDYLLTAQHGSEAVQRYHTLAAFVLSLVALSASVAHLGRPLYGFRAIMGIRHSWMSREIACFGAFVGAAFAYTLSAWSAPLLGWVGAPLLSAELGTGLQRGLGAVVVSSGICGVICSAMLYSVTRRVFWRLSYSLPRFLATTAVLGMSLTLLVFTAAALSGEPVPAATISGLYKTLIAGSLFKLVFDASIFSHLRRAQVSDLKRTALLMWRELATMTQLRFSLGVVGGVVLPALLSTYVAADDVHFQANAATTVIASLGFIALTFSELIERSLFFKAAVSPKMPGAIGS